MILSEEGPTPGLDLDFGVKSFFDPEALAARLGGSGTCHCGVREDRNQGKDVILTSSEFLG